MASSLTQIKKGPQGALFYLAEEEGFEPSKGYEPLPVFKTGAFNRSATPPKPCAHAAVLVFHEIGTFHGI